MPSVLPGIVFLPVKLNIVISKLDYIGTVPIGLA